MVHLLYLIEFLRIFRALTYLDGGIRHACEEVRESKNLCFFGAFSDLFQICHGALSIVGWYMPYQSDESPINGTYLLYHIILDIPHNFRSERYYGSENRIIYFLSFYLKFLIILRLVNRNGISKNDVVYLNDVV